MKYLPLIVITLLVLAACAPPVPSKAKEIAEDLKKQAAEQPKVEATPEAANVTPAMNATPIPTEAPQATPQPAADLQKTLTENVKEETTAPAQDRTRMYTYLDAFEHNVKSYQFNYKRDKYSVKGTRFKVILATPVMVKHVTFGSTEKELYYYDTVYVDRAAQNAIAYCEGHDSTTNRQCLDLGIYDLAYPVDFKKYNIILPEDWLLSNLNNEPSLVEGNKYYVKGRASVFLRFETNPALELSVDPGTGLIMQADTKDGPTLISRNEYLDLVSNEVRDVDVQHRSKNEIPPSEAFSQGFYK